jgi:hypothetical protein
MKAIIRTTIRIILIIMALQLLSLIYGSAMNILVYQPSYHYEFSVHPSFIALALSITGILVLSVLWWKTDWLIRVLAGEISDQELVISISKSELFDFAIRILGIYLIVKYIPLLMGLIAYRMSAVIAPEEHMFHMPQTYEIEWWVKISFYILIGVFLASGMKGMKTIGRIISNFWNKATLSSDNAE